MLKRAFELGQDEALQHIQNLQTQGKNFEDLGKKMRWGYAGIPLGIAATMMVPNKKVGAGLGALLGLGGFGTGYLGERGMGYGAGLQTMGKYLGGNEPSRHEWDNLMMNNPSQSLMVHVHPEMREVLKAKWDSEKEKFFGEEK